MNFITGSSYVSNINCELSFSTVVEYTTTELFSNVTNDFQFNNRNARRARLLEGETMGGLTGCHSFETGDTSKKEFYSPNYPKEYPKQITCTRVIKGSFVQFRKYKSPIDR
ncbi:hypothetical protein PGB90_000486 [Kerria lacca]